METIESLRKALRSVCSRLIGCSDEIIETETDEALKNALVDVWEKAGEWIGKFGDMPGVVFNWIIQRVPLTAVEVALVHPNNDNILLMWRDDEHFHGWHLPGTFIFWRESWQDACQRCVDKEINKKFGCELKIKANFVTAFNFHTEKQDPRGHATSLLFLCKISEGAETLSKIPREKGQFFFETPADIMQVKLPTEVAQKDEIQKPAYSSHHIMFITARGEIVRFLNATRELIT